MHMMKSTVLLVIIMAVMISSADAKGLYVRDRVNINLRSGPGYNSRIVGLANTNDLLEIKEESEEWTKVLTPDGQEGWILTRLLTEETPRAIIVDRLEAKNKTLKDSITALKDELSTVKKDHRELNASLSSLSTEAEKTKTDYEELRDASSDFLQLEAEHKKLLEKDKLRSQEIADLTRENTRLRTSERIKFTLVGGAFILLGVILGPLTQGMRGNKKKSGYKI